MKKLGALISNCLFLFVVGLPGYVLSSSPLLVISQAGEIEERVIKVEGMSCERCAKAIEKEVKKVPGVVDVKADYKSGTCKVKIKVGSNIEDIKKAIEKAGYKPVGEV